MKKKDNKCKIYCVFFENKEPNFDISKRTGDPKEILKQIAKLGETDNYYSSDSLPSLFKAFRNISDTIQTNYSSKYKFNSSYENSKW